MLGPATWPDLDDGSERLLLIPLGSTEQHGPHLPLDTDTRIAVAWCEALCAALGAEAMVAPPLPYGSAGEHQMFPGTLSIGGPALETVVVELARSAAHFATHVVFVSGHGGNAASLRRVGRQLVDEGHRVTVLLPEIGGGDAHAGRTETSLMLHLAPDLVRLERAEAGVTDELSSLLPRLVADGVGAVSPNGVLGDPAGASAVEGAALLDALVSHGLDQISTTATTT